MSYLTQPHCSCHRVCVTSLHVTEVARVVAALVRSSPSSVAVNISEPRRQVGAAGLSKVVAQAITIVKEVAVQLVDVPLGSRDVFAKFLVQQLTTNPEAVAALGLPARMHPHV